MENRENIPEELGPNGQQVLEDMALYVYLRWIEYEMVYVPHRLDPLTHGADKNYFPDEDYFYRGSMHPEHGSVEIEFLIGEGYDGLHDLRGSDGSVVFPKQKMQELWLRKCH